MSVVMEEEIKRWTARRLGRSPSTVSRELRRNAATRVAVAAWIAKARLTSDGYLFPSRQHASPHLSVRQHARIVKHWVVTYEWSNPSKICHVGLTQSF